MWVYRDQFVIILSCVLSANAYALEREKTVANCAGEVVSIHGAVLVRQDSAVTGRAPASIQLQPGNNVYPGDVINTGSDGAVKILLKDKTIVDLGASALFKIAQFKANSGSDRQVGLDMMFGKMRIAVPKKITGKGEFKIKTRAATMGVRGTEFVVATALDGSAAGNKGTKTEPKTDVTVIQGKVDVAKAGIAVTSDPVHLTAGSQITAQAGVPNTIIQLNTVQMTTVANTSHVADNTFTKAVTIENTPEPKSSSTSNSGSTASNGSTHSSDRKPADANSSSAPAAPLAGSVQSSLAGIAANAPTIPVKFSDIGVPGAPSVQSAVLPVAQQNKSSYHVTVVVGN
jgi:hypothetical protein